MTDPLSELPFFRSLSDITRAQLLDSCMNAQYEAGAVVFRRNEIARGMYWLLDGAAELRKGDQIRQVWPGEPLGHGSLFREQRAASTLVITERAQVLQLTRVHFASIMSQAEMAEPQAYDALQQWTAVRQPQEQRLFPGQRWDESVLMLRRRHLWALCRKSWVQGALLALAILVASVLPFGLGSWFLLMGSIVSSVILWLYQALEWWNDLLIVSNQRVINIVRTISGLRTEVGEAALANIQQVSADYPRGDPIARLLNYGTVELRTTGDAGSIKLRDIGAPRRLQQEIMSFCSLGETAAGKNGRSENGSSYWQEEILALVGEEPGAELPANEGSPINEEDRVYRKHLLVWFTHIWLGALVFLTGLFLIAAWPVWSPLRSLGGVGLAMAMGITVLGALWAYLMDWDWRHDLLILGEKTITLHHRRPLWLQSERDEILLERVDNVTSRCVGIFQTLWDYGEIRLALMGDDQGDVKSFQGVPQPQRVQQEISRRREQLRQQMEAREQAIQRTAMAAAFAEMAHTMPAEPPAPFTQHHSELREANPSSLPLRESETFPLPPPVRPATLPEDR